MKVMVTMTFDPARRAEIVALIPAERVRVEELRAQGALEAIHIAAAQNRVWLVVRGDTLEEARGAIESLPLHRYATAEFEPLAEPG
jgi:muconolactone delta-isomerase